MTPADPLATFPSVVREAHARWLASRDLVALDTVILGIVAHHRPHRERLANPAELPDTAQLITDLGFDSLALAEIVFFVEDLFTVSITNEDLKTILSVADLRAYVRAKVATAPSS